MRKLGIIFIAAVLLAVATTFMPPGFERYCPLYPSIDTQYATGFSEDGFSRIRAGMTSEEVVRFLGAPLESVERRASTRWHYSRDGKCSWSDWAWLGREVVFVDGRVTEKIATVYYD